MLEDVIIGLILVIIILIIAVFGAFWYNYRENQRQRGILETIFKDPKNLKLIGMGAYNSFSQGIKGSKGQYNKKAIQFRQGLIDSFIPPEVFDLFPGKLGDALKGEPLLITEGIKVLAKFRQGGLQGGIRQLAKTFGTQFEQNPLTQAFLGESEESDPIDSLSEEHKNLIRLYEDEKLKEAEIKANGK